jgi:hypothetical protein
MTVKSIGLYWLVVNQPVPASVSTSSTSLSSTVLEFVEVE